MSADSTDGKDGRASKPSASTGTDGKDDSATTAPKPQNTLIAGSGAAPVDPPAGGPAGRAAEGKGGASKTVVGGSTGVRGRFWGRTGNTRPGGAKPDPDDSSEIVDPETVDVEIEPLQPPSRRSPPKRSRPSPPRKPPPRKPAPASDAGEGEAASPGRASDPAVRQASDAAAPPKPPPRSDPPPPPARPRPSERPRPPSEPPPPPRNRARSERPPAPAAAPAPAPTPSPAPVAAQPAAPAPVPAAPATPLLDMRPITEVCEDELGQQPDKIRAARLHFEIAREASDTSVALKHLRLALDQAPDFLPAVRWARALELSKRNVKAAAPLFDVEIQLASSALDKAWLHYAKGCAWLDIQDDQESARASFAEAARLAPDQPAALKAHQHAEQRAKEWARLSTALEHEAGAVAPDPRHRAAVLVERARLLERRLRKPEEAVEQLQLALSLDAQVPVALQELKRLLVDQKRWRDLVTVLEREAELTGDPAVAMSAWWTIAQVQADRLSDREAAVAALERASAIIPEDAAILYELAHRYTEVGKKSGVGSALERLASRVESGAEKLAVYQRLGELHDGPKGDPEQAVRWYEAALGVDAAFEPALRGVERLYVELGRWSDLAAMHKAEGEAAGESQSRAAAHARAADVLDRHLGNPDEAAAHYALALALDPSHEGAFKALVRLHGQSGRYRELVELYDRAVERAPSEDIALTYLFKMGSLYEDVLGEMTRAVEVYRRVLQRQPNNLAAIHAVQRAAERAGLHRDLLEALDREAKLSSDRAKVAALEHRAAEVAADLLDDAEEALSRLQTLIKREPKHAAALGTLGRLYRKLGRIEDQLGIYERRLDITEGKSAKVALLVEMAEIAERQLADVDKAVGWLQAAAKLEPSHTLARGALVRLLRDKGAHQELAQHLESDLASAMAPEAFARTALLLGEIYEVHLNKLDKAVAAYRQAIDAVPGYRPALDALSRVYGQQSAWKDLGQALSVEAEEVVDTRLALDASLRSAILHAERLGKPDVALEQADAVARQAPTNISALLLLESLHAEEGNLEALAEVLGQQADVLSYGPARVAALVQRGRLLERLEIDGREAQLRAVCTAILAADSSNLWALGALERLASATADWSLLADVDARSTQSLSEPSLLAMHFTRLGGSLRATNPAAALSAYRSALKHNPECLAAIRGLAKVASFMGDTTTMVDAYRREAEWRRNDAAAADLLLQSAAVLTRLGDTGAAIDDLEKALRRSPDHQLAGEQLRALLERSGQIDKLIEVISQAAHAAKRKERKVSLWRTVGRVQADRAGDLGAAISAVQRALESAPKDRETIVQLASLHRRNAQHEEAAKLLERVIDIDPDALDAHLELARLHAQHLHDDKKARRSLDRVLAVRPDDREALRLLLQLQLAAGERAEARAVSERLLAAAGDDHDTRAWALVEIAKVELSAGDHARAAEVLHQAVSITGPHGEAAETYRKLLTERKEPWDRWVSALRDYLRGAGRGVAAEDRALVYLELANTLHKQLTRTAEAFSTLEEGVASCGEQPVLAREHAKLLSATGRVQEAAVAFQLLVARAPAEADGWRGLVNILQQLGRQQEAQAAAAPLVVLDAATPVERNLATERGLPPGAARPGAFGRATLKAISAGDGDDDERVGSVLAALADGLAKVYPAPFEMYGVRKGDRIKARTAHPLRQEVDRLAAAFGLEELDMYVHAGLGGDVAIELSEPPALMVPTSIGDLSAAERAFLIARPLAAVAMGTHAALKLSAADVGAVLAAAVRRLVPGFEDGSHDADLVARLEPLLAPSWFGRSKVDEVVQHYYAEPVEAPIWAPTVKLTVTRAAALLSGDLNACVSALRRTGEIAADLRGADLVRRSPLVEDLLGFWGSETAMEVRRLAGIV